MDSYMPNKVQPRFMSAPTWGWMEWLPSMPRRDDELTAMMWYLRLFEHWTPATIAAPTLFARATEALTEKDGDDPQGSSNDYTLVFGT
jgi:hypothetical protein